MKSNSTPRSEEDDKHSEDFEQSPPQKYLDESPPRDVSEAFAQQQRELLERLKEQFTSFPFSPAPNFAGMDLSEQAQQRLQPEAHNDFPFSFPTPPPSKGEDDVKTTSTSAKKSSQNSNSSSWSYDDQFKQVRQVSLELRFNYYRCRCCLRLLIPKSSSPGTRRLVITRISMSPASDRGTGGRLLAFTKQDSTCVSHFSCSPCRGLALPCVA
jgi:hypothetical protein